MSRRKGSANIQEETKAVIRLVKAKNPKLSARGIRNYLLRHSKDYGLEKDGIPRERSIQEILKKDPDQIENIANNPLDRPWSIGVSLKHNIPSDMIPLLIDIQFAPEALTIRETRWFTLLYPILKPRVETKLKELNPKQQRGKIVLIANQYAKAEQIAEITGSHFSTKRLDDKYFRDEDFSTESVVNSSLDLILWKKENQNERLNNQAIRE